LVAPGGGVVVDGADVVDSAGAFVVAEPLDDELLEHAGRSAAIAMSIAVVTTRCLRTRTTSVPARIGRTPYIATGTFDRRDDRMVVQRMSG
jgi:hypothetical protein